MHHLAEATLFLSHGHKGVEASCEGLAQNEEECEVEGEENCDDFVRVVFLCHSDDDRVSDEQLDNDVNQWDRQDEPLEGASVKDLQAVDVNHGDLLKWTLLSLIALVVIKCSLLFLR